jgi:ABC-type Fe3+/spermidine/putrescine transport system ATPase subunit
MRELDERGAVPGTKPEALAVRGVSKWYGEEQVLDGVTLTIAEGESLVLLGHSGSGKTTTLRLIAGLEAPDQGQIILRGRRIEHLPARERNIGVIFQHYALFPGMTVTDNIGFGLQIRGVSRAERERVAAKLLDLVGLVDQRDKYPSQLSGGQQQRVAIARALAYQPAMLLFDESFSALDPQTRVSLRSEIRGLLRRLSVPALFITHDQEEAMELGDQIAILNRGRLEQIGTPQEIYEHPQTEFVATFLGAANVLEAIWEEGHVRLPGNHRIVVGTDDRSRHWSPGEPLKVLFRPEDVILAREGEECLEAPYHLGRGRVQEVAFSGANEWLTLALLPETGSGGGVDVRSSGSPTHVLEPRLKVCRTKWDAHGLRLTPGDLVAIGLKAVQLMAV